MKETSTSAVTLDVLRILPSFLGGIKRGKLRSRRRGTKKTAGDGCEISRLGELRLGPSEGQIDFLAYKEISLTNNVNS